MQSADCGLQIVDYLFQIVERVLKTVLESIFYILDRGLYRFQIIDYRLWFINFRFGMQIVDFRLQFVILD